MASHTPSQHDAKSQFLAGKNERFDKSLLTIIGRGDVWSELEENEAF